MYDNPNRITYRFHDGVTMTGTTVEFAFRGPKGKKGDIWDYGVYGVTTALTTKNSAGVACMVAIGSTADMDAYGEELDFGGLAAEDAKSVRQTASVTATSTATELLSDYIVGSIPADSKALLTVQESSDGVASFFVTVDWSD